MKKADAKDGSDSNSNAKPEPKPSGEVNRDVNPDTNAVHFNAQMMQQYVMKAYLE